MFEKYDDCLAFQYTSYGKRMSVYNTKLHMCRVLREENIGIREKKKTIVLLYPSSSGQQQKQELYEKAENEGWIVSDMVSEAEAVVRYHCFQNKGIINSGLVCVIDIHKYNTEITMVQIKGRRITPVLTQQVSIGGEILTENMTRYYMNKLSRVKGDISGDTYSIHVLKLMTEKAKLRMAKHRMNTDEFIFRSPKDGRKYLLRIFREDFDRMVEEVMRSIFLEERQLQEKAMEYGYGMPQAVLLAGGMSSYSKSISIVREEYESVPVLAYKNNESAILGAALLAAEKEW